MSRTDRLDAAFDLLQGRLRTATHVSLKIDEPLISDSPVGVDAPLRAFTVRVRGVPFALVGLTAPSAGLEKLGLLEYLARRARARRIPYLVLTNLRDAWILPVPSRPGDMPDLCKRYPRLDQIAPDAQGSLSPAERIDLVERADTIAADLATLHRDGSLDLALLDADFFVDRLTRAVGVLKPAVKKALRTKLGMDAAFRRELSEWAVRQGIPADLRSDGFVEAVVRQAIYRLLGKIIFYQSLRRAASQLPPMDLTGVDTGRVIARLQDCFALAHRIDYHAVFREDVVDRLPFPAAASAELRDLVGDLDTRDFADVPQDVVGAVFERLIPPEDRHSLGQYFTPEPLVDLIVTFCVRNADDAVLDPTCGTGTFLIRAYDRLRTRFGAHDHSRLLSQLWGVDVAPFPAELATINLFRQDLGDPGNFPRILNEDFFDIVPGGTYRFPPLKAPDSLPSERGKGGGIGETEWVDEPIPSFAAVAGNFPYISASRIERMFADHRQTVSRRLAHDWFYSYPDGFTFESKGDAKEHRMARRNGLPLDSFLEKARPDIPTYADLYVSLFWHAAAFLRESGRMGIVTSNAWLDVGYGYALQRFLLNHFKIVAVLESRCEPWFLQAAVNTVVTIAEACSDPAERDAHPARFVKVKRSLAELIPWDAGSDALNRWTGLEELVGRIEATCQDGGKPAQPTTYEDDDFRVRAVRQGALLRELEAAGKARKWGRYLRAPDVYFDLLREAGDRLCLLRHVAPPARGGTTRINEFFYVDEETIQRWGIDPEFCWPLIKSPSESDTVRINVEDLGLKVFVCREPKENLRAKCKLGTLHYIEWGEQQEYRRGVQRGMKWPEGPWVRKRRPGWYALPESETKHAQLFVSQFYGDRHIQRFSQEPLVADCVLNFLDPVDGVDLRLLVAVLNSSVSSLFVELAGRVVLGDGALKLQVEDARDYLSVPNVLQFGKADRQAVLDAFEPLLARPIGSVFDEVHQPDRRALDTAVLKAMGLEPDYWLPRLYDGLATLVRERVQLGQMRGKIRRIRRPRATKRVAEEVLQDLLPGGPRRFPNDFLSLEAQADEFREVELPDSPLRYVGPYFGEHQLITEDGQTLTVANKFEARYVLFAQAAGDTVARLPQEPIEIARTVNDYVQYLRDLRQHLRNAYFNRTLDRIAATRFVGDVWQNFDLPNVEE